MTIEFTKPSLPATLAAIVGALLGVGVGIQQPLMTGAGLGLAVATHNTKRLRPQSSRF
jgi:hypothetical protein